MCLSSPPNARYATVSAPGPEQGPGPHDEGDEEQGSEEAADSADREYRLVAYRVG